MNKEPETYEELIVKKRCVELTKYYDLTMEELEQIYTFLLTTSGGYIKGSQDKLTLISPTNTIISIIMANCTTSTLDGVYIGSDYFNLIYHHTSSSSGSSSGGSSSNNNNNNNNNNNG